MACLPLARYLKGTFLLEVPWRYIAEKVNRRYLGPGVPQRYIREKPPGHLEKNVAPGSKALRTAFPTFSQKPFKRPVGRPLSAPADRSRNSCVYTLENPPPFFASAAAKPRPAATRPRRGGGGGTGPWVDGRQKTKEAKAECKI